MALLIAAKPFGMSANFTPSEGEHIPHRLNMQTSAFGILSVKLLQFIKMIHDSMRSISLQPGKRKYSGTMYPIVASIATRPHWREEHIQLSQ